MTRQAASTAHATEVPRWERGTFGLAPVGGAAARVRDAAVACRSHRGIAPNGYQFGYQHGCQFGCQYGYQ